MTIPLILALASCDIGTTSGYSVPGSNLVEKLDWLRNNAKSGNSYALEIGADESISSNRVLDFNGKSNITITLRGIGGNRIISLSNNGNMFVIRAGVTLVLDNVTLRGRFNNAPLVYVRAGAALKMNESAVITGNVATNSNGGGVQVEGTFIMNGGTISGNNANITGGGVYVTVAGNFTMNGGIISGNNAHNTGGGVAVVNRGTFIMSGGTISGNTANNGGGGVAAQSGNFTMSGGTISGNSSEKDGGGVWLEGDFTMSGGTISGNTAKESGGGVAASNEGTIVMNNGSITGNTAIRGGGVTASINTKFIMSGGTISGNIAKTNGGGVYAGGIFTKAGGTITSYDTDRRNGNVVSNNLGLVQSKNGHAVYAYSSGNSTKRKETTAGSGVSLSYNGRTGTFSGEWDY